MIQIHANCVAIDGRGVLIRGPSGAGKSDLTLRLIDQGAALVADDYCEVSTGDDAATATPPHRIAGLLEVRGIGIVAVPHLARCQLALVVDLIPHDRIPRIPERTMTSIAGIELPWIAVDPTAVSACERVRAALRYGRIGADRVLSEARRA